MLVLNKLCNVSTYHILKLPGQTCQGSLAQLPESLEYPITALLSGLNSYFIFLPKIGI
jgi:hypothetical protein